MKNHIVREKIIIAGMAAVMMLSMSVMPALAKNNRSTKNPPVEHFRVREMNAHKLQKQSLSATGVEGPAWGGRVSFTFDDGNVDIYQYGLPVMKKYNLKGVLFPVVGAVNNKESWSVSWNQLKEFQSAGWEIGSHTMTHPDLTTLSTSNLQTELSKSKSLLTQHGFIVKTLAYPYGEVNSKVLDYATRYYENARLAWGNNGINTFPYTRYNIVAREVSNVTTPEEVENWINQAMQQKDWLILMLHEIVPSQPSNEYQYNSANLDKIAAYASNHLIPCPTISEAMQYSLGDNLIKNPNLESVDKSGWALNWQRNNTSKVTDAKASTARVFSTGRQLKIVGGNNAFLANTTSIVLPDSQKTYIFSMFSQFSLTSGDGLSVYVDEFDSNNQHIGGKWIGGVFTSTFDETGYLYKPSSAKVHHVTISVYTGAGDSGTFYGDDFFFGIVN